MKDIENQMDDTENEKGNKRPHPEPGPIVTITINGVAKSIHRGRQTVVEIKNAGGVPLADELEQLIDGKLMTLPDDGSVVIKGQEVFMSHVRTGGSA